MTIPLLILHPSLRQSQNLFTRLINSAACKSLKITWKRPISFHSPGIWEMVREAVLLVSSLYRKRPKKLFTNQMTDGSESDASAYLSDAAGNQITPSIASQVIEGGNTKSNPAQRFAPD